MQIAKYVMPDYFTRYEGGEWYPWESDTISEEELKKRTTAAMGYVDIATINGDSFRIHSLKFLTPGDDVDWDCLNGWRNRINERESDNITAKELMSLVDEVIGLRGGSK